MTNHKQSVYRLTESALLLAIAAVLSVLKLVDMPYGGSVTPFSMLPLLIIAYRHGTKWGMFTALTYSLIQLLLGLDNFAYATSFPAALTIVLCDYLLAFLALGLGGIFRNRLPQSGALCAAAIFTGALRYLCHVITGCTVWAGLPVPTPDALVYSLSYNATYMIPEIILLAIGAVYISRLLSFESTDISRAVIKQRGNVTATVLSAVAATVVFVTVVWDLTQIVPALQNADAALSFAGLAAVHWGIIGIVTAIGAILAVLLALIARRFNR